MWKYRHFSTCVYLMTIAGCRAGRWISISYIQIVVIGSHLSAINRLGTKPSGSDPACRMHWMMDIKASSRG